MSGVLLADAKKVVNAKAKSVALSQRLIENPGLKRYFMDLVDAKESIHSDAVFVERMRKLATEFRMVKIDEKAERDVRSEDGRRVTLPLVWRAKLPCPREVSKRRGLTVARTKVPIPPKEATDKLQKHHKKFDRTEVWWVPKDIQVTKRTPKRDKDPILVGVVKDGRNKREFFFEIHRWEAEKYELPYWAHEAY